MKNYQEDIFMSQPYQSQEMNDFFSQLPGVVQQSILQSGMEPKTVAELKSVATKLMDSHSFH